MLQKEKISPNKDSRKYDWKKINIHNFIIDKPGDTVKTFGEYDASQILRKACSVFEKLPVPYWLTFGVALGFHRQDDFIPYDTDIDIGLCLDFNNKKEYDSVFDEVYKGLTKKGFRLKFVKSYGEGVAPMQIAYCNKEGVTVDVYFFYKGVEEDFLICYVDQGIIRRKIEHINNIKKVKFKHGIFPVPTPTDEYLEYYYGPTWKTPTGRKKSNWTYDAKGKSLELKMTRWTQRV